MKYIAEVYGALCAMNHFEINGIPADEEDFVEKYDHSPESAEDYACGDMRADIIPPSVDVLTKYGITIDEYATIAEDIAEKLSFGNCSWCE